MRIARTLACLATACALSPAVHAQTRTLPCAPPDGADLRLTAEQDGWSRDGKPWRTTILRTIHIAHESGGFAVTIGPAQVATTLDAADARRMTGAFSGETAVTLHLDAAGALRAIDDLDAHWSAYVARLTALARETEAAGIRGERSRAALAAMAQADEAARMDTIAGRAGPLFRLCGQSVDARAGSDPALLTVDERRDAGDISESVHMEVDASTGLLRSAARRAVPRAQPRRPLGESWQYAPAGK